MQLNVEFGMGNAERKDGLLRVQGMVHRVKSRGHGAEGLGIGNGECGMKWEKLEG